MVTLFTYSRAIRINYCTATTGDVCSVTDIKIANILFKIQYLIIKMKPGEIFFISAESVSISARLAPTFSTIFSASRFDALQMQNDARLFRSTAVLFSGCADSRVWSPKNVGGKVAPRRGKNTDDLVACYCHEKLRTWDLQMHGAPGLYLLLACYIYCAAWKTSI